MLHFRGITGFPSGLRLIICALLLPGLLWAESMEVGTRQSPGFGRVQLIGTELFRGQDSTQDIRLVTNSYHGQSANELYLDFDQQLPLQLRDSAGNYRIEEPNYIFSPEARMGSGAALFNRIENRVVISAPEELWPGHGRLHDFSIEMWLRPVYFYRRNVIFKKYSLLDGKKIGLEIYIYRQQLHVSLWNLFTDADNQLHSVTLVSPGHIGLDRWSHIALSYTATNGKLMLAVNGNEQDTQVAGDRQGVWTGAFHPLDRTPIIIGESYSGLLDELRIARIDLSTHATHSNNQLHTSVYPALEVDYESMRGEQQAGMVISEVIHPEGRHGSRSGRIRYQASQPTGTILNFWVRYSQDPFRGDATDREQPWKPIRNIHSIPDFAYIQWKAELKADPMGKSTPVLKEVQIEYQPVLAPTTPASLRVVRGLSDGKQICLEWVRSPERSVDESGGYYVYIGLRPGEYLGRIAYRTDQNGATRPIRYEGVEALPLEAQEQTEMQVRPEMMKRRLVNRVRLIIDNRMLERNIHRLGPRANLPMLEENRVYYFSVSAYNGSEAESGRSGTVQAIVPPGN